MHTFKTIFNINKSVEEGESISCILARVNYTSIPIGVTYTGDLIFHMYRYNPGVIFQSRYLTHYESYTIEAEPDDIVVRNSRRMIKV